MPTKKQVMKYWVEEKSHPIRMKRPDVEELVHSNKLEKKFGYGAMVVAFNYGTGTVIYSMPRLHSLKSNDALNLTNAYVITNILDYAIMERYPGEISTPSDARQMTYYNLVLIDNPSIKCPFCGSSFKDYGDDYASFNDGRTRGGFQKVAEPRPGGPLVVFYSTDLTATRDRIVQAGGSIARDIFDFPGGKRFHFKDPGGNELAVWSEK